MCDTLALYTRHPAAAEVWQYVQFSVAVCYNPPDRGQYAEELSVYDWSDDLWLATTPGWVRLREMEGSRTPSCSTRQSL